MTSWSQTWQCKSSLPLLLFNSTAISHSHTFCTQNLTCHLTPITVYDPAPCFDGQLKSTPTVLEDYDAHYKPKGLLKCLLFLNRNLFSLAKTHTEGMYFFLKTHFLQTCFKECCGGDQTVLEENVLDSELVLEISTPKTHEHKRFLVPDQQNFGAGTNGFGRWNGSRSNTSKLSVEESSFRVLWVVNVMKYLNKLF